MKYLIKYSKEKSTVQLLLINLSGNEIKDESPIPKNSVYAPYLAIIKGAYLAIKNNVYVYDMEGWEGYICGKIDEWFGKSFPLKFKYPNKDGNFWIKSSQDLMDKSFTSNNNAFELLEKAIIFIFGGINRIYIDNPNTIKFDYKQNYLFETYKTEQNLDSQLEEFNLFSDASVK